MLGLSWEGSHADFLGTHEHVDDGTLSNIRVANGSDHESLFCTHLILHASCLLLEEGKELGARENLLSAQIKVLIEGHIELGRTFISLLILTLLAFKLILEATMGLFCLLDLFNVERHSRGSLIFILIIAFLIARSGLHNFEVSCIDLALLLERGEENVLGTLIFEVLVPVGDQFGAQVVSLIDEQNKLLTAVADLFDILIQVLRVEKVRVSCIHDLHESLVRDVKFVAIIYYLPRGGGRTVR